MGRHRSFWWQGHGDYSHLDVVAANVGGDPKRALELADRVIAAREQKLKSRGFKDALDLDTFTPWESAQIVVPPPLFKHYGQTRFEMFPRSEYAWPDKYVLAVCYLEKVKALCALDRVDEAIEMLDKFDPVIKDRPWTTWVALEAHVVARVHAGVYDKNLRLAQERLATASVRSGQFHRLVTLGRRHGEMLEERGQIELAMQSYQSVN